MSRSKYYYVVDGEKFPRVTKVLDIIAKPEFYHWYSKFGWKKCEEIKTRRADFGTMAHSMFEKYLFGLPLDVLDDEMLESLNIFANWVHNFDVVPLQSEIRLVSKKHRYAGTCDFVGMVKGRRLIGDWKTSKKVYYAYPLQLAAYLVAYEEIYDTKLDGGFILCIRDGSFIYEEFSRDELLQLFEVFKAALLIFSHKFRSGIWETA